MVNQAQSELITRHNPALIVTPTNIMHVDTWEQGFHPAIQSNNNSSIKVNFGFFNLSVKFFTGLREGLFSSKLLKSLFKIIGKLMQVISLYNCTG